MARLPPGPDRAAAAEVRVFELTVASAPGYLATQPLAGTGPWTITELGGGVSNTVLLVEAAGGERFVLKQSLAKLRVEQDWFSDPARIRQECAAIAALSGVLPGGSAPAILWEDQPNYLFAMSAAPAGSLPWKAKLLAGDIQPETAAAIAGLQATMVRASWQSAEWQQRFGDLEVFDQLRLDPYYRATARRHPQLESFFQRLTGIATGRRVALVHGDWSPKNFLVDRSSVLVIDFEVVHFGDPAFDVAFLLNHLCLKAFHQPRYAAGYAAAALRYWQTLEPLLPAGAAWIQTGALQHLAGLMLARIDGKSPVEYIRLEVVKEQVRRFAYGLATDPASSVEALLDRLMEALS